MVRRMGTPESAGTRLLSVAGDCAAPAIYEVEWGITLDEVLDMVGADRSPRRPDQWPVGGVSVGRARTPTAGSPTRTSRATAPSPSSTPHRDLLDIVRDYTQFFVDESCGICVPCRAGTVDLHDKVDLVIAGGADPTGSRRHGQLGCDGARRPVGAVSEPRRPTRF